MKTKSRQLLMRLLSHTLLLSACFSANANNITTMDFGITAGLIGAGAALVGSGANIYAQGRMNKKTRKWNEKMYGIQRKDALADWQMQNAYNSPEQQMKRLSEAGLNPNLVYGNGAEATSAQQPRQSDTGNWNPQTPDYGSLVGNVANSMMSYVDIKAKTAQTDNIKAQNQQLAEQIRAQQMENAAKAITYLSEAKAKVATSDAQTATAMEQAKRTLENLALTGDVLQADRQLKEEQAVNLGHQGLLTQSQVETEKIRRRNMLDENTRAWILNSANVQEAKARIVSMAVANAKSEQERQLIIKNAESQDIDNQVKKLDLNFYQKSGYKAGSSPWGAGYQQANQIINSIHDNLTQPVIDKLKKKKK